eukprot:TRINITY_DN57612_c0_g1_i1.p1 TRINITY_DN57612_c0_g1~~TRINITY_DN57612_c0_g1_i1.p1  ORF type:complete len:362 (-),score=76.88 TRINITY_DN57612_c0_g1_i1:4-1089(-)
MLPSEGTRATCTHNDEGNDEVISSDLQQEDEEEAEDETDASVAAPEPGEQQVQAEQCEASRECCRCCHCSCVAQSGAERSLWLMLGVNGVLTGAQLACGVFANSLSLLGDGALMAMDGFSYAVSIYAEKRKATSQDSGKVDRMASIFSTVLLAATTAWVLFDSIDRLSADGQEATDDSVVDEVEVNSLVMIVFTAVNLVADVGVALSTWAWGSAEAVGGDGDSSNMNLFGAMAHLGADVVRGVAVLICGILAQAGVVDAAKADAYCSLFVCIFVLAATGSLMRTLLQKSNPLAYIHIDLEAEAAGASAAASGARAKQEPSTELPATKLGKASQPWQPRAARKPQLNCHPRSSARLSQLHCK